MLEACRLDVLFWINAFVYQFNPNAMGEGSREIGPFITWDFQDEAVRTILGCIRDRRDLLIEKSREMGASWLCLLVMGHGFLFLPRQKVLTISRNEAAVDRPGDSDALFWKLDFVLSYLPDWMTRGRVERRKMGFYNPLTQSSITGQASTGKAGVGGRATWMFIDEFSQIQEDYEVLHRTSDTTSCRIFNGTHVGIDTAFHELSQRVDIRKLQMHWTQHPDKKKGLYRYDKATNRIVRLDPHYEYPEDYRFVLSEAPAGGPYPGLRSPWYDHQCTRKVSPRAVAMDLDIDPGGSQSQFFEPLTVRQLRDEFCREPLWQGDIAHDRDSGKPVGLVKAEGGPLKLWVIPRNDLALPHGKYGAGADVSTGTGATNSVFSAGNALTGEKILEYANPHILPEHFAAVCAALCWLLTDEYGTPALFAWEHAGPGMVFGDRIIQLGYRNIYFREAHQTLGHGKRSDVPGWYPSNQQKTLLLDAYRAALFHRHFINRSAEAMSERELGPYRYNARSGFVEHPHDCGSEDPTGARINHGDRVIADALAWKMMQRLGAGGRAEPKPPPATALTTASFAGRRKAWEEAQQRKFSWV
jgi:hypothetical protein